MGADLIMEAIFVDERWTFEEAVEQMLEEIDKTHPTDFDTFIEYVMHEEWDIEYLDDKKTKQLKDKAKEVVKKMEEIITGQPRDLTWINHKGHVIYLTGGMSWGDSPTDSFCDFENYYYLPRNITKIPETYYGQSSQDLIYGF